MNYFCKQFRVYHSKIIHEHTIPGELYCLDTEDKSVDQLFEIENLEYKMIINP